MEKSKYIEEEKIDASTSYSKIKEKQKSES